MSLGPRPRRLPDWAGFVLAVGLFWLGGQFVTQGVSDSLIEKQPELAVLWRAELPDALSSLARARLVANDNSGAARVARRSLQRLQLNPSSLATYGLAEARLGNTQAANQLVEEAGKLGWRSVIVQIWLLRSHLLSGDAVGATQHLDAIMRREDPVQPTMLNVAELLAHDPRGAAAIAARLAANPIWRAPLFDFMASDRRPDAEIVEGRLITMLAATSDPPAGTELGPYLKRLVSEGQFVEARTMWLSVRRPRPAVSLVDNGDLSAPSDGTPFDWSTGESDGWSAEIDPAPAAQGNGLRIEYDGVADVSPPHELIVLKPGAYRLTLDAMDEMGDATQLLSWTVTCAGSGQVLGAIRRPTPTQGAWASVSVGFDVPDNGCPDQWLGVSVQQGERPDASVSWYRNIRIEPVSRPPANPQSGQSHDAARSPRT